MLRHSRSSKPHNSSRINCLCKNCDLKNKVGSKNHRCLHITGLANIFSEHKLLELFTNTTLDICGFKPHTGPFIQIKESFVIK